MTTPARVSAVATPITNIASIALIAVSDWFFFDRILGWTLGLFLALALSAVLFHNQPSRQDGATWILAAATAAFACALVYQPGPLVTTVGTGALLATLLSSQHEWTTDAVRWWRRIMAFVRVGAFQLHSDATRSIVTIRESGSPSGRRIARIAGRWALPVFFTAVFIGLFSVANPIFEVWTDAIWDWLVLMFEWLPEIQFVRIVFWIVAATVIWPLLHTRVAEGATTQNDATPETAEPVDMIDFAFRCLVLFNAVFLFQTVLDLIYLWGAAALPVSMSYAEYAHRGAYPLVATAVLAAVFVLLCFRPGGVAERDPRTRYLVMAWIGQNVLLMASSAWRLLLYIDAYQLTRLRIATILWIALVALGFAAICWRIHFSKSSRWLLGFNLSALIVVSSVSSFVDFDSRIAWYNVKNYLKAGETRSRYLDVLYLGHLGPESLPALRWYESHGAATNSSFNQVVQRLSTQLVDDLEHWQGWTFVR